MPRFTFQGPDGQKHTIEGPEDATKEQAFQQLQQHLGGQQQPADDSYQSKLTAAMNTAMKALAPSWEHNKPGYNPLTPADPNNMPNDAVNSVGTDAQMTAAIPGAGVARMAATMPGRLQAAPPPPPQQPVNMGQMPTQQGIQNRMGMGGQAPPSSPVGSAPGAAANPGEAAQSGLLRSLAKEVASMGGHAMGGPLGGLAARAGTKMLGM